MVKSKSSFEWQRIPDTGRERIIEIIFFLLNEIRGNTPLAEIDLKPLSVRGFSEIEISTAFSWLIDRYATGSDDNPVMLSVPFGRQSVLDSTKAEPSFRVYHEIEQSVIDLEARGFILQLLELGLISDADQEFLIDHIMLSGATSVSLEHMKDLVARTIFHFDRPAFPHGRHVIYGVGSDRIQ